MSDDYFGMDTDSVREGMERLSKAAKSVSIDDDMQELLKEKRGSKMKNVWKYLIPIICICLGIAVTKLWDNTSAFNKFQTYTGINKETFGKETETELPPLPNSNQEVFVVDDELTTDEERQFVTDHANLRDLIEQVNLLEEKLAATVSTVNNMSAQNLASGGSSLTESQVRIIASGVFKYYWIRADKKYNPLPSWESFKALP